MGISNRNLTGRELIKNSQLNPAANELQKGLAERFESILDDLEKIEGGIEQLKRQSLKSIIKIKTLIYEGKLSKARTEANCLKVKMSVSTNTILNLIKGAH